jgi:futalosine hydrolase
MRLLIITAVEAEARAVRPAGCDDVQVVVSGIGRTNAAAATTEAIVQARARLQPFDAVLSAGIAGALPQAGLDIGAALVASSCIYAEEGIVTSRGFAGMAGLGFALGDFEGNTVPVDEHLLERLSSSFRIAAANEVVRRTGALAEAMEGAAVVHAARRLQLPAIELRVISNTTGDRAGQRWDIAAALESLQRAAADAVAALRSM